MVGRKYWILIWYGILLLGLMGLGGALFWGRQTHWRNLDEIFRGIGTISVSLGMLLLLYRVLTGVGMLLLAVAVACFVLAFIFGRKPDRPRADP